MTMVAGTSPKAGAKLNRQQRRQAARSAKKGRRGNGSAAPAEADVTVRDIEIAARHLKAGDLGRADGICERLLDRHPNHSEALRLLGTSATKSGRYCDAVDLFKRAIASDAGNPTLRLNLGGVLGMFGRFEEAAACFRKAISLKSDDVSAYRCLSDALRAQRKPVEAIAVLSEAVKLWSKDPQVYYDLGCALGECGKLDEQIHCYLHALSIQVDFADCRRALAAALSGASFSSVSATLLREIETCLSANDVNKQTLVGAVLRILKLDGDFAKLLVSPHEGREQTLEANYREGLFDTVLDSRIFRLLLRHTVLTDPDLEISLTALRKAILFQITSGDRRIFEPRGEKFEFLCTLAEQCFNNEYVYLVSDEEQHKLDELEKRIEAELPKLHPLPDGLQVDLICLSMYRPLHAWNGSGNLPRSDAEAWREPARYNVKKQLDDYDEEGRIASKVQPITEIRDDVSLAVKEQYEENPYPRWLSVGRPIPGSGSFVFKFLFPHSAPPAFLDRSPRILVAGCGTGQHPIYSAIRFLGAEVLAVDLSARSLAYGARMAQELDVANVQFRQGDILALSNLNKRFDIIECVGVLHHMHDPIEAWKALVELLRPQGLIKVGLYSKHARDCLDVAQQWLKHTGSDVSPDSIRKFRHGVLQASKDDPKRRILAWMDFYTMSACRDLLFHVQEHRFTLPRLERIFQDLGLRFLGFEFKDPTPKRTYKSLFPEDITMTDLRLWDELEAKHPSTFAGMYQFWCQKI